MVRIRQDLRNLRTRPSSNNSGSYRQKLSCSDAIQRTIVVTSHEQKRQAQSHCRCNNRVDHPEHPGERRYPRRVPSWDANEDPHLNDRCEAHRYGAEEKGVVRILDHDGPYFGIESIPED